MRDDFYNNPKESLAIMKKLLFFPLLLLIALNPLLVCADDQPFVNARAAVLIDEQTGKILFAKNPEAIMEPASTTKIMTAILTIEKGNLNKTVSVSTTAASKDGTSMHLKANEQLTLKNLLYGLLLSSGNDAATALAESVGGTETNFAKLMTSKAHSLGMENTQFKNASGLPAYGHYTTAYDLALLTKYALQNNTFAQIVQTKEKVIPEAKPGQEVELVNHNKLLWRYPYTTGVKTGYTSRAGGCLVASAKQKNTTLIAVVLKSNAIYIDCEKLFNYGFQSSSLAQGVDHRRMNSSS
jgi:D-alanyl-D-alanine carboxypeptidase (penicillin-binding protein 5/6)